MLITRIVDKPNLQQFNDVALLATDKHDVRDYQVSGEGLAKIVNDKMVYDTLCLSAANAPVKEINIDGFSEKILGMMIWITFKNGNTAANPLLAINGQEEVPLRVQGNDVPPLFIEPNKKYKIEFIDNTWNFVNQSQSDSEFLNTVYGMAVSLDGADYNISDLKAIGRYTWTEKVPLGINIPNRNEMANKNGSIEVLNLGTKDKIEQIITFSSDNTQFSRMSIDGGNVWSEFKQIATDNMLEDMINGITPIQKISDTATNVSNSRVAFRSDTYTKKEVDDIVSAVYKYKGSVPTFADLPKTNNRVGDVYNVEDTGLNWAWDGKKWDELGMNINLELYAKKTDVPGIKVNNAINADKLNNVTPENYVQKDSGISDKGVFAWDSKKKKAVTINTTGVPEGAILTFNGASQLPSFNKIALPSPSFTGTKSQFDTAKAKLEDGTIINITDDPNPTVNISTTVKEGDLNPVTSDAVFNYFAKATQMVFDIEHPVTSKIPQYPWDDDPNVKFNNALISSEWEPVTDYDGKFLKIDSTVAAGTFTPESLPNIKGEVSNHVPFDYSPSSGAFIYTRNTGGGRYNSGAQGKFNFDASKSCPVYQDDAKVQPDNLSYKIWKRVR